MVQHTSEDADNEDYTAFAMVPTWIIRSGGKLSANAVRLYATIMTYADNVTKTAFPSRETLAEDMGVSVATVKRAIKELESFGAVKIKRERSKKNGNFFANEYALAYESPWVTYDSRTSESSSPRVTDDPPPWASDDPPPRVTDDPITRPTLTKPTELKPPAKRDRLLGPDDFAAEGEEKEDDELASKRIIEEIKASLAASRKAS